MNKDKLIKFLAFLGIESIELILQILTTQLDLTEQIISIAAIKIKKSYEEVIESYNRFDINEKKERQTNYTTFYIDRFSIELKKEPEIINLNVGDYFMYRGVLYEIIAKMYNLDLNSIFYDLKLKQ